MREGWVEDVLQTLKREIPGMGALRSTGHDPQENLFRSQRGHVHVRIDELVPVRIRDLYGRLAHAILVLRLNMPATGGVGVAAIRVDRAGKKATTATEAFMKRYAPEMGWALLDATGTVRVCIPRMGLNLHRRAEPVAPVTPPRRSVRLFSDLNCWMLKVLLLRDAPTGLYGGPRKSINSIEDLHRIAQTSRALAYRFVHAFEESGFLRRTADGFQVSRRGELMEAWFNEIRLRRNRVVPVRCVAGPPERLQNLFHTGPELKAAMAGFYACRLLGVQHTPAERREVHVLGPLEEAFAKWELEPCHERDAHFFLLESRDRQSILRGCVDIDQLPVVDILQAAVDVASHPARGREQADYILKGVLRWTDEHR